ncbi:MAG: hypothetical protein ACR2PL_20545 [Dehalococcoidia bacterium]
MPIFWRLLCRPKQAQTLFRGAASLVYQYDIAIYDALYLALAGKLSLRWITADRRCFLRIRSHPLALWIADWAPAG